MEKLHCPGCKSEHITVHSRLKYLAWAMFCAVIVSISSVILGIHILRPGEWDTFKMMLVLLNQVALCISVILFFYYLALCINKKHTSYYCRDCHHEFNDGLIVQHDAHHRH